MMNSVIDEDECPQSPMILPPEKRKHPEVGDESPSQSKLTILPPEKRSCVEQQQPPLESLPPPMMIGEGEEDKVLTFEDVPPNVQKFLMHYKDLYGPDWRKTPVCGSHNTSDEDMGEDKSGTYFTDDGVLRNMADDSVAWSKEMIAG